MQRAKALLEAAEPLSALLQRINSEKPRVLDLPLHDLLPNNSNPIEFHGLSGSGKTHLLYILAIEAVLAGKAVVVYDTDYKWDNNRLLHLIDCKLARSMGTANYTDIGLSSGSTSNKHFLDLIHVYQPQSAAAFLEDIESTWTMATEKFRDRPVRYLLVDGISAYYWQSIADPRRDAETDKPSKLNWTQACMEELKRCSTRLLSQLVYTNWDLGWPHLTFPGTIRLTVQKKEVLQFTQGLEQAVLTKDARQEVLDRGIFYVRSDEGRRVAFYVRPEACSAVVASVE